RLYDDPVNFPLNGLNFFSRIVTRTAPRYAESISWERKTRGKTRGQSPINRSPSQGIRGQECPRGLAHPRNSRVPHPNVALFDVRVGKLTCLCGADTLVREP